MARPSGLIQSLTVMAGVAVLGGAATASPAPAAATGPQVAISARSVEPGADVAVSGIGFTPMQTTSVSVCGAGGRDGSAGCDLGDQVTLLTGSNGRFDLQLQVETPPVPCPCDVVVDAGDSEVAVPISIAGAKMVSTPASSPAPPPLLEVTGARLSGSGPVTAWLGGPARRTLTFTLHNSGPGQLASAPVTLELHSLLGGDTTVTAPETGDLAAGESRTFHIPVDLGPLATGQFGITGRIESFGDTVGIRAGTFSLPWALLIAALALIQLLLLTFRNRLRARLHSEPPAQSSEGDADLRSVISTTAVQLCEARSDMLELLSRPEATTVREDLLCLAGALEHIYERLLDIHEALAMADVALGQHSAGPPARIG